MKTADRQYDSDYTAVEMVATTLGVDTALGDGQSLSESDFLAILGAYDATTTRLAWRAGDLLVADNLLTAQGRSPLTGTAEYWIAFGDPIPEHSRK